MIFICGGEAQGKISYAINNLGVREEDITDGESCGFDINSAVCINNFHLLIKRAGEHGMNTAEYTQKLIEKNPDAVIISNEIGCGIIPLEKTERIWRENAGRAGCIIAEKSDRVIRVICGIGTVIKGNDL